MQGERCCYWLQLVFSHLQLSNWSTAFPFFFWLRLCRAKSLRLGVSPPFPDSFQNFSPRPPRPRVSLPPFLEPSVILLFASVPSLCVVSFAFPSLRLRGLGANSFFPVPSELSLALLHSFLSV